MHEQVFGKITHYLEIRRGNVQMSPGRKLKLSTFTIFIIIV